MVIQISKTAEEKKRDARGEYGPEGDYVMNRPLARASEPTNVAHPTDAYDAVEWLVKNTP